jgi:hypothetical protein
MDLDALKDPLPPDAIEWRAGQVGTTKDGKPWCKVLAYLTSRAVMDRLDEVCGPTGWEDHYEPGPQGGVLCRLTVHHPDRSVTREDVAENTDVEAVKGGVSDALKRAAVKFGVGRYLYKLGDTFAEVREEKPGFSERDDWNFAKTKENKQFWWKAPELPEWATPKAPKAKPAPASTAKRPDPHARGDDFDWRQWTQPPAEVCESTVPHPWYLQAVKGLLHHSGGGGVKNARTILAWLRPANPFDVQAARTDMEVAQVVWHALCDRSLEVDFSKMLWQAKQWESEQQT